MPFHEVVFFFQNPFINLWSRTQRHTGRCDEAEPQCGCHVGVQDKCIAVMAWSWRPCGPSGCSCVQQDWDAVDSEWRHTAVGRENKAGKLLEGRICAFFILYYHLTYTVFAHSNCWNIWWIESPHPRIYLLPFSSSRSTRKWNTQLIYFLADTAAQNALPFLKFVHGPIGFSQRISIRMKLLIACDQQGGQRASF